MKEKIVAMIPARLGSQRLKRKNLALLDGKPLIYYAINNAKKTGIFNRVVVNSESLLFKYIAEEYGADFYRRPTHLASSTAKSDDVVYDFIIHNPCDILVWVNPISPLQNPTEIKDVIRHFLRSRLDSLITVKQEQVHTLYRGKPLNFKKNEKFSKTQDLEPVELFVYSIMMWRTDIFISTYKKRGYALFCGRFGTYPVGKLSSIIIKREQDLMLADYILRSFSKNKTVTVRYKF